MCALKTTRSVIVLEDVEEGSEDDDEEDEDEEDADAKDKVTLVLAARK